MIEQKRCIDIGTPLKMFPFRQYEVGIGRINSKRNLKESNNLLFFFLHFPFFSTSLSHSPSLTHTHFFSFSYSITQLLFLFFLSFSHSLTHSLIHSPSLSLFSPSFILSLFSFLLFRNILTYCRCCQRPFPSNSCTFSHLPRAER